MYCGKIIFVLGFAKPPSYRMYASMGLFMAYGHNYISCDMHTYFLYFIHEHEHIIWTQYS